MLQSVNRCSKRTYASIYICMHIHIYKNIHICTQPAAIVVADMYVGVKTHLCNVHTWPWTSARNTCSKVHATLNAKKFTYTYTYTHMHTYTYAHEHTCACMTLSTHWSTDTETHNLCTNMHKHTHTHVYKRIHIHIHTHMHIYTYIHVRTYTHIHIYTHTPTKCTYERTQASGSERTRSCCRRRKPRTSFSFDAIKPHFAPPMQGIHCTHFLRHQYPSTPHPLFPTYPRTVCKNGPLCSCRKIRGKEEVQQSPSRWARRTSSPRMTNVTRWNERSMRNNKTHNKPITQSRQRGAQTTSAHLYWCGADPPSSWLARVAGRKGDRPKRVYISAIFAGFFWICSSKFDHQFARTWGGNMGPHHGPQVTPRVTQVEFHRLW